MPDYSKRRSVIIHELLVCDYGGPLLSAPAPRCSRRAYYILSGLNYCKDHVQKVPVYLQDGVRPITYMR